MGLQRYVLFPEKKNFHYFFIINPLKAEI